MCSTVAIKAAKHTKLFTEHLTKWIFVHSHEHSRSPISIVLKISFFSRRELCFFRFATPPFTTFRNAASGAIKMNARAFSVTLVNFMLAMIMTIITRMWIFGTQFGAFGAVDWIKCIAGQHFETFCSHCERKRNHIYCCNDSAARFSSTILIYRKFDVKNTEPQTQNVTRKWLEL